MSCVPQTILSASSIALLNNARASLTKTRILFNITVLSAPTTTEKIMCIFFSCTFTTLTRIGTGSAKSNPRGALRYRALYSRRRHRTHTVSAEQHATHFSVRHTASYAASPTRGLLRKHLCLVLGTGGQQSILMLGVMTDINCCSQFFSQILEAASTQSNLKNLSPFTLDLSC